MPASFNIAPGTSAEELALRRRYALELMKQGGSGEPVGHWTQGLNRLAQGLIGGLQMGGLRAEDQRERASAQQLYGQLLAGLAPQQQAAVPASQPQPAPINADVPLGTTTQQPEGQAAVPRGIRNNNPGNIEAGRFSASQPGYQGSDGRFARFESPEAGTAAMGKLLESYGSRGFNTPSSIINRWAPPSDNNPTPQYASFVAKQLGVDPNAQLDLSNPEIRNRVAQAIGQFENGQPVQMAQAPQAAQQASPQAQGGVDPRLIQGLLGNRHTAPMGQSLIGKMLEQRLTPKEPQFKQIGKDEYGWVDPRTRQVSPVGRSPEKVRQETERQQTKERAGSIVIDNIDRARGMVEKSPGLTSGMGGQVLSKIGGTAARDVSALLDTVKANAGFDRLQQMRSESPTGGALGQVSNIEIGLLTSAIGSLEQSQSSDQLIRNMKNVKNVYLDIIHGKGKGPAREKVESDSGSGATSGGWQDIDGVKIRRKQ